MLRMPLLGSSPVRFGAKDDVVRNLKILRENLPKANIGPTQWWLTEKVDIPRAKAKQAGKTLAVQGYNVLWTLVGTAFVLKEVAKSVILSHFEKGKDLNVERREASQAVSDASISIVMDEEMKEGIAAFEREVGPLTEKESIMLEQRQLVSPQCRLNPVMIKAMEAASKLGKAERIETPDHPSQAK
jgi:hypothetical protein